MLALSILALKRCLDRFEIEVEFSPETEVNKQRVAKDNDASRLTLNEGRIFWGPLFAET
jgi:hypothetical protein